jgi:hypothetical protein
MLPKNGNVQNPHVFAQDAIFRRVLEIFREYPSSFFHVAHLSKLL